MSSSDDWEPTPNTIKTVIIRNHNKLNDFIDETKYKCEKHEEDRVTIATHGVMLKDTKEIVDKIDSKINRVNAYVLTLLVGVVFGLIYFIYVNHVNVQSFELLKNARNSDNKKNNENRSDDNNEWMRQFDIVKKAQAKEK
jgi:hypothetical protein